jgi:hypothetical protein
MHNKHHSEELNETALWSSQMMLSGWQLGQPAKKNHA